MPADPAVPAVPAEPVEPAVPSRRGRLTVYLGAAPGVGKTYAMLEEAHRRRERGTDVVVGCVETHERARTAARLDGLELLPPRDVDRHPGSSTELDTEAVLARSPEVVCVDELAHADAPGSGRPTRAEDVERIRAAGIDVITTVDIGHLDSLNDEVERITGVRQRETVPDEVVRTADQIQLVDMAPDALRRRMAHGNVYPPDRIDASLASYFRVGNLTALRELALLWLADRVDDALGDYRRAHRIRDPWPAKERIVVALTGGPESETLLRRGARLAQRAAGAELLAVHVVTTAGLHRPQDAALARVQALTDSLGGTFHSVVGEDAAAAVVDFAVGANATMIVVGVSRHGRLRRPFTGSTGERIATLAGAIDVHLVTHEEVAPGARRRAAPSLGAHRRILGWMLAVGVPELAAWWLHRHTDTDQLPLASLVLLGGTVLVAMVGGRWPAVVAAIVGFANLNWWFTAPIHRFSIAEPHNVAALAVFLAVAVAVATVVDRAARRAEEAVRAWAEAATISGLSRSVLTGQDTAEAIVEQVRETFGQRSVALLERTPQGWHRLAGAGIGHADRPVGPSSADTQVRVDDDHVMVLRGAPLRAADQRVLAAFAVQTSLVLEYRRLREHADRALALERAEATSTALLRAVSHDLRTPLATMRTALDGLLAQRPRLSEEDRGVLIESAASSAERLEQLIDDLLDLSRVEAGLVRPRLVPVSLEESLPLAVAGLPAGAVSLEVGETTPLVLTDPGLLERVVANLVGNAVRVSDGTPVRLLAHVTPETVEVLVVDRGPGVPDALRERMFEPFQRLDDTSPGGLGLGLAVARGLAEALGVRIGAEDTVGGGLTIVLSVPRAADHPGATMVPPAERSVGAAGPVEEDE
ncbi:MAG: DUF4118 domain-containing protein [Nocardioides sp.]|uniref:DUF4118 domain-containing protein n=1 Tax=Nocardioides sp. TaxID=35761 RepID=UPI0039E571A9